MKRILASLAVAVVLTASGVSAYVAAGYTWASTTVSYYINPANADVTADAAEASIVAGASAWAMQSNAAITLQYAGRTTSTSVANDRQNTIFFRSDVGPGVIAETYAWYNSNGRMTDADVVLYDGGFHFFAGDSGCSGGMYIQDVATHEFGHVLGLAHSPLTDATMYYAIGYCSMAPRTLSADDLAGIETLYPGSATTTTTTANTAPAVTIAAPANGANAPQGTAMTFSGSASDAEDGNLTSRVVWTSSLDGQIGVGGSFTYAPSAGSHVITATVTDSGGMTASTAVSISVTSSGGVVSGPVLTATGSKLKAREQANLSWSGLSAATVDVFRNNSLIATVANSGALTDVIGAKGSGTYTYLVCGSGTPTCTNPATVVF
jgi:hypothetical protein